MSEHYTSDPETGCAWLVLIVAFVQGVLLVLAAYGFGRVTGLF